MHPTTTACPALSALFVAWTIASFSSCSPWTPVPGRESPGVALAAEDRPQVRVTLEAGSRLQLLSLASAPSRPVDASYSAAPRYLLDAWWRVAMQQSARFDMAADEEGITLPTRLRLHLDAASGTLTTTLQREAQPPVPLASVRDPVLATGLDRLAVLTRVALGEQVEMSPLPCRKAYSAARDCVRFTELGRQRQSAGDPRGARRLFEKARSHDGGCVLTLLQLATEVAREGGDAAAVQAQTILNEALRFRQRLTPQSEHRLARALLIVRRDDAQLEALGKAYLEDRPHDPHGRYTLALARSQRGAYAEALPALRALRIRWPKNSTVQYHLAFALLATGDADGALDVLEEARRALGQQAIARPFAMALFHANRHPELERYLDALRRLPGIAGGQAEREVIRMQASHALLRGDPQAAKVMLTASLNWIREHAATLDRHAMELAEDGEVLLRIGGAKELRQSLDAIHGLGRLPPAARQVMLYLEGLLKVQAGETPTRALTSLQQINDTVWHNRLLAALHHRRGELAEETAALERAISATSQPLLQAHAARALVATGDRQSAAKIAAHVRERLLGFNQRKPREHPLMSPGRALAYLAVRDVAAPTEATKK